MKRIRLFTATTFLLFCLATCAHANPYMPSLVEMLGAPFAEKAFYVAFISILGIPLLFVLALVESLAVRKNFAEVKFGSVYKKLLFINLLTSIAGFFLIPPDTKLWPAIAIAYGYAVVLEWLLLKLVFLRLKMGLKSFLIASVKMNTVSYILIAAFVGYSVYGPEKLNNDREMLSQLKGKIVVAEDRDGSYVFWDVNPSGGSIRSASKQMGSYTAPWFYPASSSVALSNSKYGMYRLVNCATGKTVVQKQLTDKWGMVNTVSPTGRFALCDGWVVVDTAKDSEVLQLDASSSRYAAFSADERYLAAMLNGLNIVDIKTGEQRSLAGGNMWSFAWSPKEPKLAYIGNDHLYIYNCIDRTTRRLDIPGQNIRNSRPLAWSPDGKYIAITSNYASVFMVKHLHPNLRVIAADGSKTATIFYELPGDARSIYWTP